MWFDRKPDSLCDIWFSTASMTFCDFKCQFKSYILKMGRSINRERSGCWTHYATLRDDLDCWFLMKSQILNKDCILLMGMADWHASKLVWMYGKYFSWPWGWVFKVKFSNSNISKMGGSIDLEKQICEFHVLLDPLCNLGLVKWVCQWPTACTKCNDT